ncbi:MAG: glycogen synthase [Phycisphaerae bacterium]|nr:glycogen synthase [Phycisphaerae bacterium]
MSPDNHRPTSELPPSPASPAEDVGDGVATDGERAPPGTVLFEIAWEACNQVGGIYQVLKSKAPAMVERWGNRYCLVGPYVESKAALEFEPRAPTGLLGAIVRDAAEEGLRLHHGRWIVPGRPRILLVEHAPDRSRLNRLKRELWEHHALPSPPSDAMVDGVIAFADAVRRVLRIACRHWRSVDARTKADRRVLAHFHEWMGGLAVPMVRRESLPVATVFTTHATLLGRYLASNDERFYERLGSYDHASEAARYAITPQHAMERACAHGAHVLSTVSPITGEECAALLGRKPDMLLPNGLDVQQYNVGHEFQTFHAQFKERINRFVMGHFFPSYSFDLDRTLYFFTSGRFEPRNKGFDVCLEAMARLNAMLRGAELGVTVVFFIVTRQPTKSLHPKVLEQRGVLRELRQVCDRITMDVGEQLFRRAAMGERVKLDELIDEYWTLRLRRTQQAMRNAQLPMVVTHLVEDDAGDPVLNQIRQLWMFNRADDPVKVVYHPDFISPTNPLWGIEYEQFVRGCHLGVFPSAYEPWGYTPLECVAMGVPAVTSDLAGFGRYVAETLPDHAEWGLNVLARRGRSFHDAAASLAQRLFEFCGMDRRARIALRNAVERRSWEFDWSRLGRAYDWTHDLALARAGAERGSS